MIDESEKLYRETLKAQGKLAEDYRDDWQLPKALRPRKSLKRDKAALDDLRTAPKPAKPAWAEIDTPDTVEDGGEAEDGETEENSSETTNVTGIHNYADMGVSDVGVGADGGEDDPSEDDTAELGGVDDIAWNRQELKRLRDLKRVISDEYCALKSADKDTQAFYDKKLKMIESQESACVENLKLFNKKRLEAGAVANLVRLEIVPWQGDGTSPVQTWV